MKYRPDTISLLYFKDREDADTAFSGFVLIDDAISLSGNVKDARRRLQALVTQPLHKIAKHFIRRLLPLQKDRMERASKSAIHRVFSSTNHYHSALSNQQKKAREGSKTQ
jgi:hypothetical protein